MNIKLTLTNNLLKILKDSLSVKNNNLSTIEREKLEIVISWVNIQVNQNFNFT